MKEQHFGHRDPVSILDRLIEAGRPDAIIRSHNVASQTHQLTLTDARALKVVCGGRWLLFPGSFNPLHGAHRAMMKLACEMVAHDHAAYEISIDNAEKGRIAPEDLAARLSQPFDPPEILLTRESRFAAKSRLFPGACFVVGADTALRLQDPRFYHSTEDRDRSLAQLVERGCRFLVFSRRIHDQVMDSQAVIADRRLAEICTCIPTETFCQSDSSTRLRKHGSPRDRSKS